MGVGNSAACKSVITDYELLNVVVLIPKVLMHRNCVEIARVFATIICGSQISMLRFSIILVGPKDMALKAIQSSKDLNPENLSFKSFMFKYVTCMRRCLASRRVF